VHAGGVSTRVTGLYFIGLEFQFALASASLWGVARDAAHVVTYLDRHRITQPASQSTVAPAA
jgi:putative flavoprotein involved in K+ transport